MVMGPREAGMRTHEKGPGRKQAPGRRWRQRGWGWEVFTATRSRPGADRTASLTSPPFHRESLGLRQGLPCPRWGPSRRDRAPHPTGPASTAAAEMACIYLLLFPGRPHFQLPRPLPAAGLLDTEKRTQNILLLRLHAEVRERLVRGLLQKLTRPSGRRCSALCTGRPPVSQGGCSSPPGYMKPQSHQLTLPIFQRNVNRTIQCLSER